MKTKFTLCLTTVAILLSACGTNPTSGPFAVTAKQDVQTALKYNLVQTGAAVACSSVLSLAVTDADRADVAGDVYAIASAIDGLTGTGNVTPDQLRKAIAVVSPKSAEFAVLATTFQGLYAGIYPNLGEDAQLTIQVLHQLAQGADNAAAIYMTTPAPAVPKAVTAWVSQLRAPARK